MPPATTCSASGSRAMAHRPGIFAVVAGTIGRLRWNAVTKSSRAFSQTIHIVGFSTGGLLALNHAASHPNKRIKSVISVSAPVHFKNKNMVFIPLMHHANKLVSWVNSEGLVPFTPNQPENPEVNYQHIPIRALYQLQQLISHLTGDRLKINADVHLFQGDRDPRGITFEYRNTGKAGHCRQHIRGNAR